MTTTVTSGTTTLTPILVDGYRSIREAGNVLHSIIGTEWHAVTLRPARPRAGTLGLLCASLADALAMESLHAAAATLSLADTDHSGLAMAYVASGKIEVELADETRAHWWVRVDFQEIQP